MSARVLRVTIHVDGGARGNPGPAGAGVVIADDDDDAVIYEAGLFLGHATNNVAEYKGMLHGLEMAQTLKAQEVSIVSDSELLVRQMNGQYKEGVVRLNVLCLPIDRFNGQFTGMRRCVSFPA